ncbi:MAG: DinB family protein [Chloroflexi bacterium]|nr:DinB family protein [Chloroflexota bacterium]MCI0805029.1 DinB family protein [Chloroflexota bacterium]MCI0837034.1 DinB family protein [Chloroflexota bacterium]MCI0882044.1 DinB family protein [Chloroflexota bacterium]
MSPQNFGDHRDLALQSIGDYGRQLTRALTGLELEEARWMPTPQSNHILWILWHMGRMEDMWGSYLRGGIGPSAWIEGRWADRLGIDAARNGSGDSVEQVRDFPDVSLQEVTAYWQAARDLLIPAVETITHDMLQDRHPEIWTHAPDRAPTLLWVLGRIPVENSQHTGQIAYIRGLYSAKFR